MKYYILYNPLAGNGDCWAHVEALSHRLEGETEYIDMTEVQSYAALFAAIDAEDALILCGGDGTINRFVNDTEGLELCCDVLYFATGTGNDFLRDLEKGADEAPLSIKKYLSDLPCVQVNGKQYRFLNNVGFGIDGYCCEVGDELKKTSSKPVNYTAVAIKGLLFHYRPTNAVVSVDGVEYQYKKVWLAPTMKGRFYGGGMMAAPAQDRTDEGGSLSVMLFHGAGRLKTLMAFPSIFKGEHVKRTNMVALHTGKEIYVKFDRPSPMQIDGETILGVTEYRANARVAVEAAKMN